jgi:hypothetical protein
MKSALLAFAAFLAVTQIGLGLSGVGLGFVRGQCSSEEAVTIDGEGNPLESRQSSEQCSADFTIVALGGIVAAGGGIALRGLLIGTRRPLAGAAAVAAGAILGLPLYLALIFLVVPFFLAVAGVTAIYLASQDRRHTPTEVLP